MTAPTTVILGTGIIGISTAYYLSQTTDPSRIHLVDPSPSLLTSASGFAAGFLAKDWFSPPLGPLGRLSFELHKKLADEEGGREKWGCALSWADGARGDEWLVEGGSRAVVAPGLEEEEDGEGAGRGPRWLVRGLGEVKVLSGKETSAQVDPRALCQFLLDSCLERGVSLHHPCRATSITSSPKPTIALLNTVTKTTTTIPYTSLLISAGPWSRSVFSTLFPSAPAPLPIASLAGHSLVVRSPQWTPTHESGGCHAVLTEDPTSGFAPEIFSRVGGEIYVAGLNDSALPLPGLATDAKLQEEKIARLKEVTKRLVIGDPDAELEVIREELCFRPVVSGRGVPIVERVEERRLGPGVEIGEGRVFVGAGHGPWGISLSLGTGKVLVEMIEGRETSCDVSGLRW